MDEKNGERSPVRRRPSLDTLVSIPFRLLCFLAGSSA